MLSYEIDQSTSEYILRSIDKLLNNPSSADTEPNLNSTHQWRAVGGVQSVQPLLDSIRHNDPLRPRICRFLPSGKTKKNVQCDIEKMSPQNTNPEAYRNFATHLASMRSRQRLKNSSSLIQYRPKKAKVHVLSSCWQPPGVLVLFSDSIARGLDKRKWPSSQCRMM